MLVMDMVVMDTVMVMAWVVIVMDTDMATVMVMAMAAMDMAIVMDTDMVMVMDIMAMVDTIMEKDLLNILRHQSFMLYLKDPPMLDMDMLMAMDMATDMAMDMATDMAMIMVDIVTVMVTMVVRMAMDTMEVIISPAFMSYYCLLYEVTRD